MKTLELLEAIDARACRVCGLPIDQPGPATDGASLPCWGRVATRNGREFAHLDCSEENRLPWDEYQGMLA